MKFKSAACCGNSRQQRVHAAHDGVLVFGSVGVQRENPQKRLLGVF